MESSKEESGRDIVLASRPLGMRISSSGSSGKAMAEERPEALLQLCPHPRSIRRHGAQVLILAEGALIQTMLQSYRLRRPTAPISTLVCIP